MYVLCKPVKQRSSAANTFKTNVNIDFIGGKVNFGEYLQVCDDLSSTAMYISLSELLEELN